METAGFDDKGRGAEALLLITDGCPHCPQLIDALTTLVKEGSVGVLELVNVKRRPERAVEVGARTVPWYRIGPFTLDGARPLAELRLWTERAAAGRGSDAYLSLLLSSGRLNEAERWVHEGAGRLAGVLPLIADTQTPLNIRLGVGALIEGSGQDEELRELVPALGTLSRAESPRLRADACHYLAVIGGEAARHLLAERRDDPDPEVREIVHDGLAEGVD